MNNNIIHITDNSFDKNVIKNNGLILVDFWAQWCNPCKILSSILDEIADEYQDKLTIAKINIDHNSITASKYGIRSIPTLLLFKDSKLIATKVGVMSKDQLQNFLTSSIV